MMVIHHDLINSCGLILVEQVSQTTSSHPGFVQPPPLHALLNLHLRGSVTFRKIGRTRTHALLVPRFPLACQVTDGHSLTAGSKFASKPKAHVLSLCFC